MDGDDSALISIKITVVESSGDQTTVLADARAEPIPPTVDDESAVAGATRNRRLDLHRDQATPGELHLQVQNQRSPPGPRRRECVLEPRRVGVRHLV